MAKRGHFWVIGYDDMGRAEQVRAEITGLAAKHSLILLDTAVVVRYRDGSVTLEGEPFRAVTTARGHGLASLLTGLALGAPPLTGAAVGAFMRGTGYAPDDSCIDEGFARDVEVLMKPGTSALSVLDQEGDMEAILQGIRGLGGTVLKTNVDLERAKLIQSTLAATAAETGDRSDR
ncbi:MAG TPA: DUF1269 domain-containing protein [Candidatus Binataceae bacterium]|jgi:uncharacterized membrane protein|nr:DUF1269 domain-containing protein [Candidatus Binataceae bacterium]